MPRAALVLWQSVALAAVLAALGAGLSLVTDSALATDPTSGPAGGGPRYVVSAVALALTAVVLGRLLLSGHRVGTRIRALRRRHRELVDLLAADDAGVRLLDHRAPMAYCLPGGRARVVLSAGAKQLLAADELTAVLAHEWAHLRARHDLVLEAFTVLHEAFPRFVSSGAALNEVRFLVEVLADRAARRRVGPAALVRALVALSGSRTRRRRSAPAAPAWWSASSGSATRRRTGCSPRGCTPPRWPPSCCLRPSSRCPGWSPWADPGFRAVAADHKRTYGVGHLRLM